MKTAYFTCCVVGLLSVCWAVQGLEYVGKPKKSWWESLVPTVATKKPTSTTSASKAARGYNTHRFSQPPSASGVMDGVMDKMPADSDLLTQPPPGFVMPAEMTRIVNGHDVNIAEFPYQLQLAVYGQQICGAAIISSQWAVTAAHCMFNNAGTKIPLNAMTLRAGATYRNIGGSVHMVDTRTLPAPYSPGGHDHDLALLRVSHPFVFSKTVKPIALPAQGQEFRGDEVGVLTGWGHTQSGGSSSDVLKYVLVPLVPKDSCERSYNTRTRKITSRMLCAGAPHRDSCQGDSGGPLAVDGKLVGIVSFGIGCAEPGYPGVNTKVSYYRTFIKKYTGV